MIGFPRRTPRPLHDDDLAGLPHVVIVGGGFAGANAAVSLGAAPVRVTLVDRDVYKTFQPLLYQVATGGLNPGDVTMFLRGLAVKAPNMRVRQGVVVGVDTQHQTVHVDQGDAQETLHYDYLVLANGLTTNFMGTPGAQEHAMPMYTRPQAMAIRDRIFAELERTTRTDLGDPLVISVVGGGATGVEIAGALADFRQHELSTMYPEMDHSVLRIRVIQRGKDLLKNFAPHLREYTARELEKRGVELQLGLGVKEVGYDYLTLADGTVHESDITIWAAGVSPEKDVAQWGLPTNDRGALPVSRTLQVRGLSNVFAAGDIAVHENPVPQQAQPAIQTGHHVARAVHALVEGRPVPSFRYRNLGEAATIGRRAAILSLPFNRTLTGTAGWFGWLGVHVMKLMGHRNRRAAAMNLISLYAGRGNHQPNPVVGDVDSLRAARTFETSASRRKFGQGNQG